MNVIACDTAPKTSDLNLQHLSYRGLQGVLAEATEKKTVLIIDIRPPEDFEQGHIPGAVNIPDPKQFMLIGPNDPRLLNADKVVVYGEDFRRNFADPAAKRLIAMGYSNIFSFPGGWREWQSHNAPPQPAPDAN